jgi:hypothetical protein
LYEGVKGGCFESGGRGQHDDDDNIMTERREDCDGKNKRLLVTINTFFYITILCTNATSIFSIYNKNF